MANKGNSSSKPVVHVDRSSISGQFVTGDYARKHPNTTEHQRIKKPSK
jgi:hypothetical protein